MYIFTGLPIQARTQHVAAFFGKGTQELRERIGKEADAIPQQCIGDGVQVNAVLRKQTEGRPRLVQSGQQALFCLTMVAEGVERGHGEGVHGVFRDQGLDVVGVWVVGVFGAGAPPEEALDLCAPGRKGQKAGVRENLPKPEVGHLGVGDRGLSHQGFQRGLTERVGFGICEGRETIVHAGVNSAHKETGHRGDPLNFPACGSAPLQPRNIGPGRLRIGLDVEEQRHVDVDPLEDERFDGRNSLRRGGDFNHQVIPPDGMMQPEGLVNALLRTIGQVWGDLQTDVAVASLRAHINRIEEIGRILNIPNGQRFVDLLDVQGAVRKLPDGRRIVRAAADAFLEDGRIGSDPHQPVALDHGLQLAGEDHPPTDIVEPGGLSQRTELDEWIHEKPSEPGRILSLPS